MERSCRFDAKTRRLRHDVSRAKVTRGDKGSHQMSRFKDGAPHRASSPRSNTENCPPCSPPPSKSAPTRARRLDRLQRRDPRQSSLGKSSKALPAPRLDETMVPGGNTGVAQENRAAQGTVPRIGSARTGGAENRPRARAPRPVQTEVLTHRTVPRAPVPRAPNKRSGRAAA